MSRLTAVCVTSVILLGGNIVANDIRTDNVALTAESKVRFATAKEGAAVLTKRDRYLSAQSAWDRPARMKVDHAVTEADYLAFLSTAATDWKDDERQRMAEALNHIHERLRPWNVPFPKEVLLVKTTGKEEGRAAYCRENAVVLPQRMVDNTKGESLERLLLHELFHVLSSHNGELREKLYGVIGFANCGPIELPRELADLKITNPDAPTIEHVVEIDVEGKPVKVAPMLLAKSKYDPKQGGEFFAFMQFRLLVVESAGEGGKIKPTLRDGKPWLLEPSSTPGYHERIGRNTGYIIHPEEIMADNFVLVVMNEQKPKTPRILDEVRKILAPPPGM